MSRAQMTWSSPACAGSAALIHTGSHWVKRSGPNEAGYYFSRDSSWDPASEAPCRNHQAQPCQMLLGLHRALAKKALGQSDLLPQQGPSSGNRSLLHPNLPTGLAVSLYSDVRWCQNFKYSRSCVHLGFTHLKLPLKCNPDELLGMDSSRPYCLQPHLGDCFQKGAE